MTTKTQEEEQSKTYFKLEELALINKEKMPHHVAIIMDGNRRWERGANAFTQGHEAGAKTLLHIVRASIELGIRVLTAYGFSTENWSRSSLEINSLFRLFESYLDEYREKMAHLGIRFHTIGNPDTLPKFLKDAIQKTKEITAEGDKINFVVAINYGSRDELKRSFLSIHEAILRGDIKKEMLSEKLISQYLDTGLFSDPDLLIRTSGELRLSNFLLWQIAYSEFHITDKLWPDFKPQDLLDAVLAFQSRKRRVGK